MVMDALNTRIALPALYQIVTTTNQLTTEAIMKDGDNLVKELRLKQLEQAANHRNKLLKLFLWRLYRKGE